MQITTLRSTDRKRKVLMQAPKNGFFYVLDRETGKLISAEKARKVTWADHIDLATGRAGRKRQTSATEHGASNCGPETWAAQLAADASARARAWSTFRPSSPVDALSDEGIDAREWKSAPAS